MKSLAPSWFFLLAVAFAGTASAMSPKPVKPVRTTLAFDADWRFLKSDATGAEQPAFDDASWRPLDLPHDWSIEGPFDEKNPTGGAGAFLPSGIGWYRKHFVLPASAAGRRVFVEFDGVMQNSDVWINGRNLGHRPFGYVSFRYELTDHLKFGEKETNLLAVRADTSAQPASRWYSGAGIYRHVRLIVTDPVHLEQWATFVAASDILFGLEGPKPDNLATVRVQSNVVNQSAGAREVALHITLFDPAGKMVATLDTPAQTVAPNRLAAFQQQVTLTNPRFWDINAPQLYRARVEVRAGNLTLDDETVAFGIRDARFDAERGFLLNGRSVKIKGVCLHHDASAFGAAVPLAAWERRLKALREVGVNAIRTAHNPPAPEFLDLCDRLGFLVMDELFDCWTVAKNPHDYHLFFEEWSHEDTRDTVHRDRNHPSIILYSAGNEIHDTPKEELAKKILAGLVKVFHENDPTRPVTQALFRPNVSHDYTNGLADLLDVVGTNYRDQELLAAWRAKPTRKIVGTEQGHDRSIWLAARDNPQHAGQFLWSGVDYLGESRRWPIIAAGSGLLDKTAAIKPMAYERQSWWSEKPVVHVVRRIAPTQAGPTDPGFTPLDRRPVQFADWNPRNTDPHDESLEVYSNCETVELFLNGVSLGSKPLNADASPRTWTVAYAPGNLKAVASNRGGIVATDELRTAGRAAKIALRTDRPKLTPSWDDVSYLEATVLDANGIVVPDASDLITFTLKGPAAVIAVDSADNSSHEPYQASERRAFRGRCLAIVRANATKGEIVVTASAPGLESGTFRLEASAR